MYVQDIDYLYWYVKSRTTKLHFSSSWLSVDQIYNNLKKNRWNIKYVDKYLVKGGDIWEL